MNYWTASLDSLAIVADDSWVECPPSAADVMRAMALKLAVTSPARHLQGLSDDDLLDSAAAIEHLGRYVDALRVEAAAEVAHRSIDVVQRTDGLAARKGAHNAAELIERVTRVSGVSAARRIKLGLDTRTELASPAGPLSARFAIVADALESGFQCVVHGVRPCFTVLDRLAGLAGRAAGRLPSLPVRCVRSPSRIRGRPRSALRGRSGPPAKWWYPVP